MVPLIVFIALVMTAGAADLRFAARTGEFEFNTGVLVGKLHGEGKSVGALPVTYLPTNVVLTQSMGMAGHYRLFSGNRRFGSGAWYWPSEAKLLSDGSVEVHWPIGDDHPFEMWAVYRWEDASTLDVETRVRPNTDLEAFELFMAWYFSFEFNASLVHAGGDRFLSADEASGTWQLFPRDAAVAPMVQDGRWKIPPNPIEWAIRPSFGYPIGVRRQKRDAITAIVMSRPEDCFAIATPHETEAHHSLYLSLFGRTIHRGETARARTRTVILPAATDAEIVKLYERYAAKR